VGIVSRSQGGGGSGVVRSAQTPRATAIGGDITLNNITTYVEVAAATGGPGSGGLDLTIAAATSDVLLVTGDLVFNNVTAVAVNFDVATIVAAAPVNWLAQTAGGTNVGLCFITSGAGGAIGYSVQYVVQAGDISGGNVVLRLMYRSGAATNRVVGRSNAGGPLMLSVANLLH
jgi:hypothetical protein